MQPPPVSGPNTSEYQRRLDYDQLNLLATLTTIFGIFALLGICFGGIYILLGFISMYDPEFAKKEGLENFSGLFFGIGGVFILGALVLGSLSLYAAKCIRERRNWIWIIVAASINCLQLPIGTALGVFTFVVLTRPSVRELFEGSPNAPVRRA